jgi:hypothetical protein
MLDWLIIGGGIHGTHLALVLTGRCGIAPERLRILDPHEELLAHWDRCAAATGMAYLRSTVVHHLALDPHDLWNFAQRRGAQPGMFRGPYRRPALRLFREHCQTVIAANGLDRLHLRGRAAGLARTEQGWCVESDAGNLAARRVLLALSVGEQPRWPAWAAELRAAGGPVRHLYGCDEPAVAPVAGETVVVGGGISAAQAAVALARAAPGSVTLLLRHDIRVESFDSPPGWVGPKELRGFHAEPSVVRRRVLIAGARRPGSMPEDVARNLRRAERWGLHTSGVARCCGPASPPTALQNLNCRGCGCGRHRCCWPPASSSSARVGPGSTGPSPTTIFRWRHAATHWLGRRWCGRRGSTSRAPSPSWSWGRWRATLLGRVMRGSDWRPGLEPDRSRIIRFVNDINY